MDKNQKVAEILFQISEYLAMQNVPFKPRAYEKAGEAIASLEENIEDIYKKDGLKGLRQIPSIGASIAELIEEFIKTGKIKKYDQLQKKTPVNLTELSRVEGLGPKSIQTLHQKLGITNLKELEKAAKSGDIAALDGFGQKKAENILKGIEFAKTAGARFVLGFALPKIQRVKERLEKIPGVEDVIVAGSARRRKETVGDFDILAIAEDPTEIMETFVKMPEVVNVTAKGDTKASARFSWGMDVDVRVVPRESYGAALMYFTGSKDHNVALRQLAINKGYKLNEYGLFSVKGGSASLAASGAAVGGQAGGKDSFGNLIAGRTEEEIYKALGMQFIPPEMRENTGEIQLALKGEIPRLVELKDIMGDLQVQTAWTDGKESIENMALAAMKRGLKYMAVTDHTKNLAMTGGLDEKRILKQIAEIDGLNKKFGSSFRILKGTECDILKDGSLDLPDKILTRLDVVGVSIHSYFRLPKEEQTKRVIKAISNPHADIFFHPTGRVINKREPCELDMDQIIAQAKKTGTVLEIDSYPDRTDLKDEYVRKCVEAGVKMSIDSDAHASPHFAFLEFGATTARRGWAKKEDIINAWPAEKMLGMLKN